MLTTQQDHKGYSISQVALVLLAIAVLIAVVIIVSQNEKTGESLHPDPNHPSPVGPHTDYVNAKGERWRLFPDGHKERKR